MNILFTNNNKLKIKTKKNGGRCQRWLFMGILYYHDLQVCKKVQCVMYCTSANNCQEWAKRGGCQRWFLKRYE